MNQFQHHLYLSVCLLISFQIKTSNAQITTDRPSQSDNSYVLETGYFQFENAFNANFYESAPYTNYQFSLPATSIRYGLHQKAELRLGAEYNQSLLVDDNPNTYNINNSNLQHLQLGTKIQLLKRVAWISHILIPVDNNNAERLGQLHKVTATFPLTKKTSITSNLVYRRVNTQVFNDLIPNNSYMATLNFWSQITPNLMLFSEPYILYNNNSYHSLNFNAGFAYVLHENHQIDLSAGTSVHTSFAPQSFVALGYSFRFKK
jgi:hypothetical protein